MADGAGLMRGKRGLIMGVANNRSIAWGIAAPAADTAPISPSPIRAMHSRSEWNRWPKRSMASPSAIAT